MTNANDNPRGLPVACPFCGHEPQDLRDAFHPSGIRWREDHGQRHYISAKDPREGTQCWELSCLEHEGGCGASMSGDGREEVLAKWNRRVPATDYAALLAEVEALREDAGRLDWFDANWFSAYRECDPIDGLAKHCVLMDESRRGIVTDTFREAIDQARGKGGAQ